MRSLNSSKKLSTNVYHLAAYGFNFINDLSSDEIKIMSDIILKQPYRCLSLKAKPSFFIFNEHLLFVYSGNRVFGKLNQSDLVFSDEIKEKIRESFLYSISVNGIPERIQNLDNWNEKKTVFFVPIYLSNH